MKFIHYEEKGKCGIGILNTEETHVVPTGFLDMQDVIENMTEEQLQCLKEKSEEKEHAIPLECVKILAPIQRPLHDILCVGVNYSAHMQEAKDKVAFKETPKETVYFSKRASRILGPDEAIQARFDLDDELDYEVELAIIIGKSGRDIKREEAEEYIFGYSVFNDLSSRKLQRQHVQWLRGKSLDTYTAMGPVILHKSALPFPVSEQVIIRVNGEVRQHSDTTLLIKDIPGIIAELSAGMTLEAGDIIATGTPAGVGMGFTPPRFLKHGDVVECEIPAIGILKNKVE